MGEGNEDFLFHEDVLSSFTRQFKRNSSSNESNDPPILGIDIPLDGCSCSDCGWSGLVADCETELESEGWEYEPYQILICPVCSAKEQEYSDGCIENSFPSEEQEKMVERGEAQYWKG